MIPVISSPCEAAREQADACHHDPRLGAGDACLEILGKATVASEPSEGAFDDPSSRLWLEGPEGLGSGDDLDRTCPARRLRPAALVRDRRDRRRCGAIWGTFVRWSAAMAPHRDYPGHWRSGRGRRVTSLRYR